MSYSVITLQEEIFVELQTNTFYRQLPSQAVNVAPYYYVTPYVRIKPDPLNNIAGGGNNGIIFRFLTAPVLPDVNETGLPNANSPRTTAPTLPPMPWREDFLDCGGSGTVGQINIPSTDTFTSTSPGKIYTIGNLASDAGFKAITNPAAFMTYMVENANTVGGIIAKIRFDIYLVCRGF